MKASQWGSLTNILFKTDQGTRGLYTQGQAMTQSGCFIGGVTQRSYKVRKFTSLEKETTRNDPYFFQNFLKGIFLVN